MNVWLALIGGIILGWLIEWLIDWYYWRRGAEAFYAMEHDLRQELHTVRQELEEARATLARLQGRPGSGALDPTDTDDVWRTGAEDKNSQVTGASGERRPQ